MDPNLRAFVTRLVPRVSLYCPPHVVRLAEIREVALREGALVLVFTSGIEIRLELDATAWGALLEYVMHGEPLAPSSDEDAYRQLATIVGAVPRFDA